MKIINNLNLNKNELQNAVVHNLAAAPSNPVEGQQYYNTSDHKLYVYDGTNWVEETSQGHALSDSTPEANGTGAAGTSTSVSRADHVHPTDTSRASATDLSTHTSNTSNPHSVTKSQVGLSDVTNDAQVKRSEMGVANGVATLDNDGKVPSSQLPSYVDDVIDLQGGLRDEAPTGTIIVGAKYYNTTTKKICTKTSSGWDTANPEKDKIYVDNQTDKTYRWSGSAMVEISASLALGETSSTAYRGDRGKTAYDHSQASGNPHGTTAAQVGATAKITANNTALTASGGLCTWTISNTLATADVVVQIKEVSSDEFVLADVTATASTITIKIVSASDIAADTYRAIIIG